MGIYGNYLILQGSTYTRAYMEISDTPGVELYTDIYGNYLILQGSTYTRVYMVII